MNIVRERAVLGAIAFVSFYYLCHQAAGITLLHEFSGGKFDTAMPASGVVLVGSQLYGTAIGENDQGAVYSLYKYGFNYQVLQQFETGHAANSTLAFSGPDLYGTDFYFGTTFRGQIFYGNQTYQEGIIFEFNQDNNEGTLPFGGVTLNSSTLYGTTIGGGNHGDGVIYSINTNGSEYYKIHDFNRSNNDGYSPRGVTINESTIFGTTSNGGRNDLGVIYSVEKDGTDYKVLHEFTGGADDGASPRAKLILQGSKLYGTTALGGNDDFGTVFSMNLDGTDFTLLHEFSGGADDGEFPVAELVTNGSTLFGTSLRGGDQNLGTIFSLGLDGSNFSLLHEFAGGADDGASPRAGLTYADSTLYGTTYKGGDNDLGTVFSLTIPEPNSLATLAAGVVIISGFRRRKRLG